MVNPVGANRIFNWFTSIVLRSPFPLGFGLLTGFLDEDSVGDLSDVLLFVFELDSVSLVFVFKLDSEALVFEFESLVLVFVFELDSVVLVFAFDSVLVLTSKFVLGFALGTNGRATGFKTGDFSPNTAIWSSFPFPIISNSFALVAGSLAELAVVVFFCRFFIPEGFFAGFGESLLLLLLFVLSLISLLLLVAELVVKTFLAGSIK